MDVELSEEIGKYINQSLIRIIISNQRKTDREGITKIKIRPVMVDGVLMYQGTEYVNTQVYHHNYLENQVIIYIINMLNNSFKQCEILSRDMVVNIMVSKKGKPTIKRRKTDILEICPNING